MAVTDKHPDKGILDRRARQRAHNRPLSTSAPLKPQLVGVTGRSVLLGLTLSLLTCAILPYNDYYVAATYLSGNFFPISALVGVLLVVLLINPLLIAIGQRRRIWAPSEVLTVWTMVLVVAGIPSSGLMRYLIPHLIAPHYYANLANGWETTIISHMPSRLFVNDPIAVQTFFEGLHRGESIPWKSWTEPLTWWGIFVVLLFLGFFCLSTIVRRQWVENEKFSFPLVHLPVMLAETPGDGELFNSLLSSKLLWFGVVLVTCLHTAKGLHLFVPTIPDIPVVWHSQDFVTSAPWNSLNDITFAVYPLIIGFAYLISSEVCLSLWLFYLIFKMQVLIATLYNWDTSTNSVGYSMGPTFITYQEAGGVYMTAAWLLYSMRRHLRNVWRKALYGTKDIEDHLEPVTYRFAVFGAFLSIIGLFMWLTMAAGVQPTMAAGVLVGAIVIFIIISWIVAQTGVLFVTHTFVPSQILTAIFGSHPFTPGTLAMSSIVEHVGWQDPRELMMPSLLNSYRGALGTSLNPRSLVKALAVCIVLSIIVSAVASIWLPYTHGGGTAMKNRFTYLWCPQLPFQWTSALLASPTASNPSAIAHMVGGSVMVLLLFLWRARSPTFPIHPAGFLVASSWAMYTLWFSLFLGWLIKGPILRYGGISIYRKLLPFFLGLILGDCLNAILWTVIGLITKNGYDLLPN